MNQYILSYKSIRIAQMKENEAKKHIKQTLLNVATYIGREKEMSEAKLESMTNELFSDIKKDFNSLASLELVEAMRMGSRGYFGEVYTFSLLTICKWIKAYLAIPERKLTIQQFYSNPDNKASTEPTPDEKEAIEMNFIQDIIERFKRTRKLVYYCPIDILYDSFIRYGMRPMTEEDFKRYKFDAESAVYAEVEYSRFEARINRNKHAMYALKFEIELMEENQFKMYKVLNKAKEIHVKKYLSN